MPKLPLITLETTFHRGAQQLFVRFGYHDALKALLRQIPGTTWSASKKGWYLKNTSENLEAIQSAFKGKAIIKQVVKEQHSSKKIDTTVRPIKQARKLSADQRHTLNQFVIFLRGKRYSKSTVSTYSSLIADFIAFMKDKPMSTFTKRDVESFAEGYLAPRQYAISTQRQFISAMKQFIRFYPETTIEDLELERPKRSKLLPTILSPEEVIDLIRCTKNLKHRAILGLLYSSGLRISELVQLEIQHINVDRRQLHIKNAKGRKDRYVVLSEAFLPLLRNYIMSYKPKLYFVEGHQGGQYSASSVRKFLKRSCQAARIYKRVTPHTLRHSYATHLLEQGVGLRHIQELLGHARPETTMIYTHVAKKDLMDIKSPLDAILLSLAKRDKQEPNILLSRNNNL